MTMILNITRSQESADLFVLKQKATRSHFAQSKEGGKLKPSRL